MIDEQLDAFPGHESFVLAVLGLRSGCEQLVRALEVELGDARAAPDGPIVDFMLGIVSLSRTLHGVLSTSAPVTDELPSESIEPLARVAGWLR